MQSNKGAFNICLTEKRYKRSYILTLVGFNFLGIHFFTCIYSKKSGHASSFLWKCFLYLARFIGWLCLNLLFNKAVDVSGLFYCKMEKVNKRQILWVISCILFFKHHNLEIIVTIIQTSYDKKCITINDKRYHKCPTPVKNCIRKPCIL